MTRVFLGHRHIVLPLLAGLFALVGLVVAAGACSASLVRPASWSATTTTTAVANYDYDRPFTFAQGAERSALRAGGASRGLGAIPPHRPAGVAAEEGSVVYRGLAEGEDFSAGLTARNPGAGNDIVSHIAGQRDSQWISTTKSLKIAHERYGQYRLRPRRRHRRSAKARRSASVTLAAGEKGKSPATRHGSRHWTKGLKKKPCAP
jgi:hypothetical protein